MYYVTTKGRNNITLFLVDRSLTKSRWWTVDLFDAMAFRKRSAAEYSAKRLRYKSPEVVEKEEAEEIEKRNTDIVANEEHPFSSDALGQWQ